jgi:5'-nucleotidase
MRILVSNDDGITAPGLAALVRAVSDLGEVTVAAPASPQSAMAHSITLSRPLTVQYVTLPGESPVTGQSIDGRPADCVRLAIRNLMDHRPDLVLSGINAGSNVGVNVFYSGTVAAAAEGAMIGIPAVAFSTPWVEAGPNYMGVAHHCRVVLEWLLQRGLRGGDLINVNVPHASPDVPRGLRVCEQSDADVDDTYVPEKTPEGVMRYQLADTFDFTDPHHESDVALLREGYITVTPLRTSLTDEAKLHQLRENLPDSG